VKHTDRDNRNAQADMTGCLMLIVSFILIALSFWPSAGCTSDMADGSAEECEPCSSDLSCEAGLACDHETWLCKAPGTFALDRGCSAECLRPEVTTETGVLSVCAFDGSCDIVKGKCRATSESDCSVSWVCAMQGQCRLVDGQCAK